jgi:hypothetical protein
MAVPTWHLQSASWPEDGQEVYVKTLNPDIVNVRVNFLAKNLTYRPVGFDDTLDIATIPWWFVTRWRALS